MAASGPPLVVSVTADIKQMQQAFRQAENETKRFASSQRDAAAITKGFLTGLIGFGTAAGGIAAGLRVISDAFGELLEGKTGIKAVDQAMQQFRKNTLRIDEGKTFYEDFVNRLAVTGAVIGNAISNFGISNRSAFNFGVTRSGNEVDFAAKEASEFFNKVRKENEEIVKNIGKSEAEITREKVSQHHAEGELKAEQTRVLALLDERIRKEREITSHVEKRRALSSGLGDVPWELEAAWQRRAALGIPMAVLREWSDLGVDPFETTPAMVQAEIADLERELAVTRQGLSVMDRLAPLALRGSQQEADILNRVRAAGEADPMRRRVEELTRSLEELRDRLSRMRLVGVQEDLN